MSVEYEIVDVTPENESQYDLFCKKSKKKEDSYQAKRSWFEERYKEGLRIKVLYVNERGKMTSRGFIEYVPGEYSWRAVNAPGYSVIHCLWVVGKYKKKGFGRKLLETCIEDAKKQGKAGVVMVANDGTWATGKKIFIKNGFELVDTAPMGFELLVKRFSEVPNPTFPTDWDKRQKKCGKGLTIFYSTQCPYIPEALKSTVDAGQELGVKTQAIELKTAKEVQERSPTPYGVFGMVYDGELLGYHYLKVKDLQRKIQAS